mmetsp:Transcript_92044/g.265636  ORF Transcript_92044/g.265636 Transcript_92044/m.265636 type:complete len:215 (-) Transcript_92044:840-1484(-)
MHRLVVSVGMSPVSAKFTDSKVGCLPMASHKPAWSFVEMAIWLRFNSFSAKQSFTKACADLIKYSPPRVQRPRFNLVKLSKMWSVRRDSRNLPIPLSVSKALSNKLTSPTPSISSRTLDMANNSLSTRFLPSSTRLVEWPVTKGMGMGARCCLSHSFKYRCLPWSGGSNSRCICFIDDGDVGSAPQLIPDAAPFIMVFIFWRFGVDRVLKPMPR